MSVQVFAPSIPCLNIGGRNFTDLKNLIILTCYGTASATTGKSTFRLYSGTSGYQVPASKTLRILAIKSEVATFVAGANVGIGYGDNDIGLAGNTTPTNAVVNAQDFFVLQAAGTQNEFPCNITVPTGKYPYMNQGSSSVYHKVTLFGYLE